MEMCVKQVCLYMVYVTVYIANDFNLVACIEEGGGSIYTPSERDVRPF